MTDENAQAEAAKAEDLQKRVQGFNEEMIPLLGKYKLGLGAVAFLTTDGRVAAKPQLFDDERPAAEQQAPEAAAPAASVVSEG